MTKKSIIKMISNAAQSREYNRNAKLQEYLTEKSADYESYPPFTDEVQLFLANFAKLKSIVPGKEVKGTPVTESKKDTKTDLALDVNEVCTSASSYALAIGDKVLQSAVRFRTSDIKDAKDADVLPTVASINAAIKPLLTVDAFQKYGITANTLDSLSKKAVDFDSSIGSAKVVNSNRTIANQAINTLLKTIRGNIQQLNLLINFFNKKNPGFVTGYRMNARVDYSGIRHSGVAGVITNLHTGAPVVGATISGEGKKKIAHTDNNGAYKLIKLKVGNAKLTITMPGYDSQTVDVKIMRSRIGNLNIALSAQIISMATA